MSLALRAYHRLPRPARALASNVWALYLDWWRYGPRSGVLLAETLSRDTWNAEQWKVWQEEHVAGTLRHAAVSVPYYAKQWGTRRRRGDRVSYERLENWPVLDRETVQREPRAFLSADASRWRLFRESTSGTTGTPLEIWKSRDSLQHLYALAAGRIREWNGVSRTDRWAALGGRLIVPVRQRRPPFWVWNAALRQLYMSTYHLSRDLIPHYLEALVRYRVTYVAGYTSALHTLASEALRLGRTDLRLRVAIAHSEPLHDDQRLVISRAFQCPVRHTYGQVENVTAGSTCAAGRMHLWPEVGFVELLEDGRPAAAGTLGELLGTSLLNQSMPLIRYRTGDFATWSTAPVPCSCGRSLPVISELVGRVQDRLLTRDGREIFWFSPIYWGMPVREGQIVQETLDRSRIRFVAGPGFDRQAGHELARRLRERLGDVEVELEEVTELPRGVNGKLAAVVCQITRDERRSILGGGSGP